MESFWWKVATVDRIMTIIRKVISFSETLLMDWYQKNKHYYRDIVTSWFPNSFLSFGRYLTERCDANIHIMTYFYRINMVIADILVPIWY